MAKSTIEIDKAFALIDRVAQELGLLVDDSKSFGRKVEGPSNKHRMYVQKGRFLGRIDTTLPLDPADPAYVQMGSPNGSIRCHVKPDMEQLERCLRMLADTGLNTQVPNKPRPFAATKASQSRRPKAVAAPVPPEVIRDVPVDPARKLLEDRVALIRASARAARIRMVMENPEKYGVLTEEEATALVDGRGKVDTVELIEATRNAAVAEASEAMSEAGIEAVA
jgi:hypothetical protein